jgi:hypothetical protein
VSQTDSVGQAAGQNPCKALKMNSLQNKRLQSTQTVLSLVKRGQNEPTRLGFGPLRSRHCCRTLNRLTLAFSIQNLAFTATRPRICLPPTQTRPT